MAPPGDDLDIAGNYLRPMSDVPEAEGSADPQVCYEIRVDAALDSRWATWFDGLRLTVLDDRITRICGPVSDQAALYGILDRLRDLGLPLILVRRRKPRIGR
jgi:hypothetical protein